MPITVVNKYKITPQVGDFYIGRGSPLGNPFRINGPEGYTRTYVLKLYEQWFQDQLGLNNGPFEAELNRIATEMLNRRSVRLVCFCSPLPCHGDIIKKFICERLQCPSPKS